MACIATVQLDSSTMLWATFPNAKLAHEWVREWIWDKFGDVPLVHDSHGFSEKKVSLYTSEVGPGWGIVVEGM